MNRSVAALGDVLNINTWSSTSWYFFKSGKEAGIFHVPWRLELEKYNFYRWIWNAGQLLTYGNYGGFQYSSYFLDKIERSLPGNYLSSEVISFNQCFPRARTIKMHNGKSWRYIDATLKQLFNSPAYNMNVPGHIREKAYEDEYENYQLSEGVVTMSKWAAKSVIEEYKIPGEKVHIIMPGANIDIPPGFKHRKFEGSPGSDRPFRIAFIGKDWKRKGLPVLIRIADELTRRGYEINIVIIGYAPQGIIKLPFVDHFGFIDKSADAEKFLNLVGSCDMGGLFSESEALGISVLEFLRLAIPIMGYAHQGAADTIPPDAGLRFSIGQPVQEITDKVEAYLKDKDWQVLMKSNAKKWSEKVTWSRCINEWNMLLNGEKIIDRLQPWKGLEKSTANEKG